MAYLWGWDVRDEKYYVIVETPGRNLGRDLVMIFDQGTIDDMRPVPESTVVVHTRGRRPAGWAVRSDQCSITT